MLRVTIELVPGGDESRKRTLLTGEIENVTPESGDVADYKATFTRDGRTTQSIVTNWTRAGSVEMLVAQAMHQGEVDEFVRWIKSTRKSEAAEREPTP